MKARRAHGPDAAGALLASVRAVVPGAQRSFELLVASLRSQIGEAHHACDVGEILEAIAQSRLYRLAGHASFDAFVRDALGISRTTAHRLRTLARAPASLEISPRGKIAAYEAARDLEREKPTATRVESKSTARTTKAASKTPKSAPPAAARRRGLMRRKVPPSA